MSAPAEFATIGLLGAFAKVGPSEYHGPCPFCGGHDRFAVFCDKPFPKWNAFCRKCDWKGWADQINPALKQVRPEQREKWERQAEQEAHQREEARRRKLAEFSNSELWAELHDRMTADNRAWWRGQGIPNDWQDFWKLGFTTAAPVSASGSNAWAYTIPFFSFGWSPVNMQYRLVNPPEGQDKYRWKGLGYSSYFTARPDMGATDEMLICEGAKKAMVAAVWAPDTMQIFAVPSKSDFCGIEKLDVGGRVWIILDPDATAQARVLSKKFSDGRMVILPTKLDDAINGGAKWVDIRTAMNYSRRLI